ncbi:MAG: hypothetical protein IT192_07885 [Microbacteriaceae bacterium]|nr:hypothetical protein [Microbacteriaceae bacterium]
MTDDKDTPDQSDDGLDAWFASNFGATSQPESAPRTDPTVDAAPNPDPDPPENTTPEPELPAWPPQAQPLPPTQASPEENPFANFPPPATFPDLTLPPPEQFPSTSPTPQSSEEPASPAFPSSPAPPAPQWPTQSQPITEAWTPTGLTPGINPEAPATPATPMPSEPTQAWPIPPVAPGLAGAPPEPNVPADPTEVFAQGEALDRLFGESQFQEYEAEPLIGRMPASSRQRPARPGLASAGIGKTQKVLMWVAGGLVAALALVVLFYFGTKLPGLLGPSPVDVALPTNTPTPTPTEKPVGPLPPGEYRWDELLGGECLDPYNGPWVEKFTVVDCEQPHPAQLVARGEFTEDDGFNTPYPGIDSLQAQATGLLCTSASVIDYSKASAYTDIQYEASFAVNATDWAKGDRDYYCFVSRSSGGAISGSLAVPPPVETVPPEPEE